MKKRKIKPQPVKIFEGKEVSFLDHLHGFWRLGSCYKEEKGFCWMRDKVGKRYKTNISNVQLFVPE
jgi:hypothetical protein